MEHPVSIEAGRKFANDDERRKVMLERARPQLNLEQRVTDLEAQIAAQAMDYNYFLSLKEAHDELERFIRENYEREIDRKEPQHQRDAVTAILHYARFERELKHLAAGNFDAIPLHIHSRYPHDVPVPVRKSWLRRLVDRFL